MTEQALQLLSAIDASFYHYTGVYLPCPPSLSDRYDWLHNNAPYSLVAHNSENDPKFIYTNMQALKCFKYPLQEFLGLPSRLSASETDQPERQALLQTVKNRGIAFNYSGPRVDKHNNQFIIYDGIVWQSCEATKPIFGQAALFWPDDSEKPYWFSEEFFIQ
ncbi:MEKHLA domain-containing protein [Salmonella enterica]|uniref:MEKHLA domain-containing protein n=1 Tax=Salmonella enterica TaxID=28901 RepID=UPI00107D719B|nr:MEKHLA domain-containing protein [Salmonella enterica subsp. enterica serovar Lisboa]HCB4957761.1 MEKHLA domain-containing protein [Salmonella enterica subsp. enterica serovar Bredeney]HCB5297868.1 MEKHLA domain-containing protein [Salmonella enterica subsp. enterica serovar Bredeney]